ncbi:MAG: hypothetical protein V4594_16690 [Bacteroidota bacterium]
MAQNTAITISFQARDWETIMSIIDNSPLNDLRRLKNNLINYYAANANPQGTTPVPITTKESVVVALFQFVWGTNALNYISSDTGNTDPFRRIIAAIRAAGLAVVGDTYITTQLATMDAARAAQATVIRKNGREIIMSDTFDSN